MRNSSPYLEGKDVCVFDIETTGLSAKYSGVISASFFYPESEELVQLFCDEPGLEKSLLAECRDRLSACDAVISYNGDSFDLPFLNKRLIDVAALPGLPLFKSVDLFKYLRRYWPAAKTLESLSQKSVEQFLGLSESRDDLIGGRECIELYRAWLQTGREELKQTILLHNADDVRQLARVYASLNFLPWHEIALREGYPLRTEFKRASVRGAEIKGSRLSVKGRTLPGFIPASIFEEGYGYEYSGLSGEFKLELYLIDSGDRLLADLDALPVDQAAFEGLPGVGSGYLIVCSGKRPNAAAVNALVSAMLRKLI